MPVEKIGLPLLRTTQLFSSRIAELYARAGLRSCLSPKEHSRETLHSSSGLVVGVIAVFAPDEMRCAHALGMASARDRSRDRRQRFRPSALVRVLAARRRA